MTRADRSVSRLEALLEEQAALRRVATLVAGDAEARSLFDAVCRELGALLRVETTDILRFEDDGTATVVGGWAAAGGPSFPVGANLPVDGDSMSAKLRRSGRPQRVDDYADVEGELAARLRSAGFASAAGAPIRLGGRLWGGIMAASGRPHAFPAGTERRIADFAELVTAALASVDARQQLEASRARLVEAGDEERRRLGRDLHDGAQQELVGAVIRLKVARQKVAEAPEEAGELLEAALEQVEAGIRDLRELAAGIHPTILTDRGLAAALEALANRSAVPVELGPLPAERLPASVELTAYFVAAEALTNAAKHAGCSHARLEVRVDDGWAVVEVRDDGAGGADPAGSGLRGLADRVSALGGRLEVHSAPGRGTTVTARIAADAGPAAVRLTPGAATS